MQLARGAAYLVFVTVALVLHHVSAFPSMLNRPGTSVPGYGYRFAKRDSPHSVGNLTVAQLGALANGVLNGSLPGVTLPVITLPGLSTPITISLPPVVAAGRKAIPDAAHPFQAPGPSDQRGGCPGLNAMANYGYIPRNGIASATDLLYGMQEFMGIAPDLSAFIVGLGLLSCMDPTSLKMSIGLKDSRTDGPLSHIFGTVPGCFDKQAHGSYEIDGSVAYIDSALTPDGITSHFSSDLWAEAAATAQANNGLYDNTWVANLRYKRYQECIAQNPDCYWGVKELVFYAAEGFSWSLVPYSDVGGNPTAPTDDKVSRFWGASRTANGSYVHAPEQLTSSPDGNWYRRGVPWTVAQAVGFAEEAYLQHPVLFGGNNGKVNSFVPIPNQTPSALNSSYFCTVFDVYQEQVPAQYALMKQGLIDLTNILLAPARVAIGCP